MQFVYEWVWPGLTGVLVFILVSHWSPRPTDGPFTFIWWICVVWMSWTAAYVVWKAMRPRAER